MFSALLSQFLFDPDLAGVAPIYRGRLQPIGQIGSLVRFPQGLVDLIATVTLVGIAELSGPVLPGKSIQHDDRWLQVQLLGEIDRSTGRFQRGVGSYPGLDDPVHFAMPDQLRSVFPDVSDQHIKIQACSRRRSSSLLGGIKLVVRHSAIVGSTGSGKTSAVASLLQSFVRGGWKSSNIIVVDPHGEYSSALAGVASIKSVLNEGQSSMRVPYWSLPASDILRIFAGSTGGATVNNRFNELVTQARRNFAAQANWLNLDPTDITADTRLFHLMYVLFGINLTMRTVKHA